MIIKSKSGKNENLEKVEFYKKNQEIWENGIPGQDI